MCRVDLTIHEVFMDHAAKISSNERPRRSLRGVTCRERSRVFFPKTFSALKTDVHAHGAAAPGIEDRMSETGEPPALRTTPQPGGHLRFNPGRSCGVMLHCERVSGHGSGFRME
jgi:hypothetical protein